jgi:hypothetical protein
LEQLSSDTDKEELSDADKEELDMLVGYRRKVLCLLKRRLVGYRRKVKRSLVSLSTAASNE